MLQTNTFATCTTAQLKADGTQTFCADTLQWERKRWMVCRHAIGLAGLVSDENYALWVAMYGTRPGVVRAHGAGLHTVLRLAHLGPQGQTTQPSLIRRRQPHRDAADAGCAVERKYAVLSQNDRGRPLPE